MTIDSHFPRIRTRLSIFLWRVAFLVAILFTGKIGLVTTTHAQNTYDGIDVIFLVDQSGSMGGRAFGATSGDAARDPYGLRFEGVQYAFSTLRAYQLVAQDSAVFRMAVVGFGDQQEISLPWTEISRAPDWESEATRLTEQLSAAAFGERNLGNTDFLGAYEQAAQLFSQLPANENHLRVIILLSDGAPCAPSRFTDINCSRISDQMTHMEEVQALTNSTFPQPNHHLFVIAVDENNLYWATFAPLWNNVVQSSTNARRVTTATEVGQQFLQILTDMLRLMRGTTAGPGEVIGQEVVLSGTGIPTAIAVSPYNQIMRITVFKSQPDVSIVLSTPQNQPLTVNTPGVQVNGQSSPIETWTITNPVPGNWTLLTSADVSLMDVYLDLLQASPEIDISQTTITRYLPVNLTLQIVDSGGITLPQYNDPRYRLAVEVTAIEPNGNRVQVNLEADEFGVYTAAYTPTQVGVTRFALVATTQNVDGTTLTLINQPGIFTLDAADLRMTISQTPQDRMFISEIVTITTQLQDEVGEPFQPNGITVEAGLRGSTDGDAVAYNFLSEGSGLYTLSLPINEVGNYQFIVRASYDSPSLAEPLLVAQEMLPSFAVNAAQIIDLRLLSPTDQSTAYTTDGFPPFNETTLDITVRTVDITTESTVDLLTLGASADALPLDLTITTDDGTVLSPPLVPSDETGVYRVTVPNLAEGTYTVAVRPSQVRIGADGIFNMESSPSVVVMRSANPAVVGFYIGSGLLAFAIISTVGFFGTRMIRRRQHVATGQLILLRDSYDDKQRTEIWRKSLDADKSNSIMVKRGLPPEIKQLHILSDEKLAVRKDIRVVITFRTGKSQTFLLSQNTERPVFQDSNSALILSKDPSEG